MKYEKIMGKGSKLTYNQKGGNQMKKIMLVTLMIILTIALVGCTVNQQSNVKIDDGDIATEMKNETEDELMDETEDELMDETEIKEEIKTENQEKETVLSKADEQKKDSKEEKQKIDNKKTSTGKQTQSKLTNEQIADKVIKGEYGNGDKRKEKLEAEGYDYKEIQKIVKEKLPKPTIQAKKNINNVDTNKSNTTVTTSKSTTTNQTNGFNFKGHHFSLANFSGSGYVPKETNNVYRWTDRPSHYLIERISPAGRVIRQVGIGDKVIINGESYTVHTIKSGVPNDNNAYNVLTSVSASISFQTCDTTKGPNGNSDLTIWWANKE